MRTEAVKTDKNCCASFARLSCLHLTSYRYCLQLDPPPPHTHTHTHTLSALLMILSASRLLVPDLPLLVPRCFLSSAQKNGTIFPFLSDKNPLWTPSYQTSFYKTMNLPCFQVCAAIFLHLKSLYIYMTKWQKVGLQWVIWLCWE